MAYLARIEPQTAEPIALMGVPANDTAKPDFSRLEWSVIRLARVDSLGTLREPGRWGRFRQLADGPQWHAGTGQ